MTNNLIDEKPYNPRAFATDPNMNESIDSGCGMTLRDYFAGQCMAGALSHPQCEVLIDGERQQFANDCYALADAMLKARNL